MREVQRTPAVPGAPLQFSVLRVPFFLEPTYPRDESWTETNLVRLQRKWGGKRAFEDQKRRHGLKERGREVGIDHFVSERAASNTLNSHRIVQWVTKTVDHTAAEQLYNRLNHLHFEQGRRLNDAAMLIDEAAAVGADPVAARRLLDSNEGEAEIKAAGPLLAKLGVQSIPTFIVDGRYLVNGAAKSAEFIGLFRKLEQTPVDDLNGQFVFGKALGIPDDLATRPTNIDDSSLAIGPSPGA